MTANFADRYGPWAVIAGASEGLGAAFADGLARRGLNLVLIARRPEPLAALADALAARHRVEVRVAALDVAAPDVADRLDAAVAGLDVGLVVCNAAYCPIGPFLAIPLDDLLRAIDVNVRAPIVFVRRLAPAMVTRGRGGVVVVSSLSGLQGSPKIVTYAATKALLLVLAEGLWAELRGQGVDVVGVAAGAIRTPGYTAAAKGDAPGTLDAVDVAERALAGLGRGPRVVPGWVNALATLVMGRLLPRRAAIAIMGSNTKDLQ